jgi:hypothetical protein
MIRLGVVVAALAAFCLTSAPSMAVTAKEKMVTCKFGADNQKLKGAARMSFLSKCMEDPDAPVKRAKTAKKTNKKPATAQ